MTVDVIIPTYRPDKTFIELIRRLQRQDYPIHKIYIINTKSGIFPEVLDNSNYEIEIKHISQKEFDHGGTRNLGARMSDADIVVYMTQDAVPADKYVVTKFVELFKSREDVSVAYGRQLPAEGCNIIERYTRRFNYPEESCVKSVEDLEKMGIKTFFCSDVCSAYRRNYLLENGGFEDKTIFNEDMIFAGKRILAGDKVAYVAEARIIHSHNYTCRQQFKRNFDIAVSQVQHPEVFANITSEGEGIRLVKQTAQYLAKTGHLMEIMRLIVQSGCKYAGYFLGKRYRRLPQWLILKCTSSKYYWNF